MRGWMRAAGCLTIPDEMADNEDFLLGWKDGKLAMKKAQGVAGITYGTEFLTIRALTNQS